MKFLISLAAALLVAAPSAALAAKPPKPAHPTQAKNAPAKVLYILRGTLSGYTAATADTPGKITITVSASNRHAKDLRKLALTFPVDMKTKVVLKQGKPVADGDRGIVKVRATKKLDVAALQLLAAKQVVDQGAPASAS